MATRASLSHGVGSGNRSQAFFREATHEGDDDYGNIEERLNKQLAELSTRWESLNKLASERQGSNSIRAIQKTAKALGIVLRTVSMPEDGCELSSRTILRMTYQDFQQDAGKDFFRKMREEKPYIDIRILGPTVGDLCDKFLPNAGINKDNFYVQHLYQLIVSSDSSLNNDYVDICRYLVQKIREELNAECSNEYFFEMDPDFLYPPRTSGAENTFRLASDKCPSFDKFNAFDTSLREQIVRIEKVSKILDNKDTVCGWIQGIIPSADFRSASSETNGDEVEASASLEDKSPKKQQKRLRSSTTVKAPASPGRSNRHPGGKSIHEYTWLRDTSPYSRKPSSVRRGRGHKARR